MDKPCILRALSFQEGEIPCIFGVVLRPLLQGDLSGRGLQLPCGSAASWGQRLLWGWCTLNLSEHARRCLGAAAVPCRLPTAVLCP